MAMTSFQAMAPYQLLGGDSVVRWLTDRFYDVMDSDPSVADLRALHPQDLSGSRQKLYMFLSGWLGGPPLYMEAYGHPRLRMRHLPFAIDVRMRDQWLHCMRLAMTELLCEEELKQQLLAALANTADFMRNQPETGTDRRHE